MSQWTVGRKETLESKATQREVLSEGVRNQVKKMLEDFLEMILEEQRKQRSQYGPYQRNGFYRRTLGTAYGVIEQLTVPRVRQGRFDHNIFAPFQRRDSDLDMFLTKLFLQGESYRDLQRTMQLLFGDHIALGTLTRLTNRLQSYVQAFHQRRLEDVYDILWVDGMYLRVKEVETEPQPWVMIAVMGHNTKTGVKELLEYRLVRSESFDAYCQLFRSLRRRGLVGWHVKVLVHDGHASIKEAIREVFGAQKLQQNCIFHKLQNISQALRNTDRRDSILAEAAILYQARSLEEYLARRQRLVARYHRSEPEVVRCLLDDELIITKYTLPCELHRQIQTTNPLERFFREVRRRTKVIGSFENIASLDKILFLVTQFINQTMSNEPFIPSLALTHN